MELHKKPEQGILRGLGSQFLGQSKQVCLKKSRILSIVIDSVLGPPTPRTALVTVYMHLYSYVSNIGSEFDGPRWAPCQIKKPLQV